MPLPRKPSRDAERSRQRIFAAAASEFAARGFAGAKIDRIAAAARLNKAMIYYHFKNKAALYQEILREMFQAVSTRVADVTASPAGPADKIRGFIEAIALEAEARPHFPPIWFREIADGGSHLDPPTLSAITGIVRMLSSIVQEGVAAGIFQRTDPLLLHGGIVGPLLLYFASGGLRLRIDRGGIRGASAFSREEVVRHVQRVALGTLEGRM